MSIPRRFYSPSDMTAYVEEAQRSACQGGRTNTDALLLLISEQLAYSNHLARLSLGRQHPHCGAGAGNCATCRTLGRRSAPGLEGMCV